MKEMLKRIIWVAFILIVLTAISGFLYTQKQQSVNTPNTQLPK
ncbi:hypothetical protein [uncultured Chryseobacterium sp.]|nr:hypothetical protein [uncultured Chryseobacterium sp.]